jgi:hypothetical protein
VMTNATKDDGKHAPMGQFARMRTYPTAEDKDVTAPNADTLYTLAWLDLSKEPYVVTTPDMKGRYFMLPMLDAWTNVFQVPGSRTTGTGPQKYVITGPKWHGTVPAGVTQYKAPTNTVWILGRIYSDGTPQDLDQVHALQDQMTLVPLSAYGKPYTAPPGTVDPKIDMKTPVRDQVGHMDAASFFGMMSQLMATNPPAPADKPMLDEMAKIGIVPGKAFDASKLSPGVTAALEGVPQAAQEKIKSQAKSGGAQDENGWLVMTKTGVYGTEYLQRAFVTAVGLGANRPEDAVYPVSMMEGADHQPYDGAHKYVVHFDKGQTPPVKGFWSLTMYDEKLYFVANSLNRYNVSSRSQFKQNADGSTDIYLQKDSPGTGKEANWLPAPAGKFALMLRLYWPDPQAPTILDGSWKPPAVKQAD